MTVPLMNYGIISSVTMNIRQKSGRGVPKIVEIYGREAFKFEENDIVVTIPFNRVGRVGNNVGDKVGNKQSTLNQTRQTILSEMRNNPNITKAELSRILGISTMGRYNTRENIRESKTSANLVFARVCG